MRIKYVRVYSKPRNVCIRQRAGTSVTNVILTALVDVMLTNVILDISSTSTHSNANVSTVFSLDLHE